MPIMGRVVLPYWTSWSLHTSLDPHTVGVPPGSLHTSLVSLAVVLVPQRRFSRRKMGFWTATDFSTMVLNHCAEGCSSPET
jgi:hypothetical protein